MSQGFQAVRGMNDILPATSHEWEFLEDTLRAWVASYGYRQLRTPLLEPTALFTRSIGEVTDIVEKEMYSFTDALNGEQLTLRPEATASSVRAVLQHNLLYPGPQRLWYLGPMFRHERPQKGRYRQFHQCGVEALGYAGPDIDAELILMTARLWRLLDLPAVELQINTLGSAESRQQHRERLIAYFSEHVDLLDEDARRRMHSNPLRILDTKNPAMQALVEAAPRLADELDDASRLHFQTLCALLDDAGVPYVINHRLVRGLDYYNATVFEWVTDALGAQGTVCAGGRYDGLIPQLGGKPTPAAGFAMGLERLLALREARHGPRPAPAPQVYLAASGEGITAYALRVAELLRDLGYDTLFHAGGGSFKSQLKRADGSGAEVCAIIGDQERADGSVALKPLRGQGEQHTVTLAGLAAAIAPWATPRSALPGNPDIPSDPSSQ
ncbi:MAG: histidine--tRNA ligase [Pseudomonadota bacterium]|nr:histidine--tRNA ligase [Pseudomonadota bacterium]